MPDPTRRRTLTGSSRPVLRRAADRDADPADAPRPTRTTPPAADLPAAKRHPGRPAGQGTPRVALYARILPATDQQLAQAVQRTGRSKQDIVEEALQHWLDQHPP